MSSDLLITQPDQFHALCERLQSAPRIAFDTEFVPEYTFVPMLCLIQVATDDLLAVIDPLAIDNVEPFWRSLLGPDREIVVHAGKEEMTFCLAETGELPLNVIDIQLAGGLVGLGYPLSYSNLTQRLLNATPNSAETRTDWRKRPLSDRQIEYALDDVRHLLPMRDRLGQLFDELGRQHWLEEEMDRSLKQIQDRQSNERWRRVAGTSGFGSRDLAVLRELVDWRDRRAKQLNKPVKWILRDDLLAELAKRKPTTIAELQHTRGIGDVKDARWAKDLLAAVERGIGLPEVECPPRAGRRETTDEQMIVKLLSAAMIHLAQSNRIAAGLLGSNDDLRELLDWRLDGADPQTAPRLARGWRAEVCGNHLTEILSGNVVVRVQNEKGAARLVFEPRAPEK